MKKNKIFKNIIKVFATIFCFTIAYFVAVYFFMFKENFFRNDKIRTVSHEINFFASKENYERHLSDVDFMNSLNPQKIQLTSFDKLKLTALLFESPDPKKYRGTVLLMHGYTSNPLREFATIGRLLISNNYNVVLPFQRSHGESEGNWITFGVKESVDCRDWMLKINELYGNNLPIFVGGISMGGATVTMASGLELPDNVCGFIADCGFTSPWEITYWELIENRNYPKILAWALTNSGDFIGSAFFNFPFKKVTTEKALNKCDKPFLFISGTNDHTVPFEMTVSNYNHYKALHPEITDLLLIENAPHAVSYLIDEKSYSEKLLEFLNKYGK